MLWPCVACVCLFVCWFAVLLVCVCLFGVRCVMLCDGVAVLFAA